MRWLVTVGVVAGLALTPLLWSTFKEDVMGYANNPMEGILVSIDWILSIIAVVLLNTPSARSWFAAMKHRARRAA